MMFAISNYYVRSVILGNQIPVKQVYVINVPDK